MIAAQVHRFGDKVAVYVGNGETTYLTAKQARALARALNGCARSVVNEKFVDSNFRTVEIPEVNDEEAKKEISRFPRNKIQPEQAIKASYYSWLGGQRLQHWYKIRIENNGDTKHIVFCSKIHVNKEVKVNFGFASNSFTDKDVLNDRDLMAWVLNRYGDVFVKGV